MRTWAPASTRAAYAGPARAASEPSSLMRSSTRRPRRPPTALISSCQKRRPWPYPAAAEACAPVCETTAPTMATPSWAVAVDSAATKAAAKSRALVIQAVIDGVAAHRDQCRALESHEHRTVGLLAGGAHGDDAVVGTRARFALADDLG